MKPKNDDQNKKEMIQKETRYDGIAPLSVPAGLVSKERKNTDSPILIAF